MNLVNLWYKYRNRFLNSNELLEQLEMIDLSAYKKSEIYEIKKLVEDIKFIKETTENELDEIEVERLKKLDCMIKTFEEGTNDTKIEKLLEELYREKKKVKDGGKLYETVLSLLSHHTLVNQYVEKMTAKETLELITQYIDVPYPLKLTQDTFNDLVQVGVDEDNREALWRLAVHYQGSMDFTLIEDYFIEKRDVYYLVELICSVGEYLDKEKLLEKVKATKDTTFIASVLEKGKEYGAIADEV